MVKHDEKGETLTQDFLNTGGQTLEHLHMKTWEKESPNNRIFFRLVENSQRELCPRVGADRT